MSLLNILHINVLHIFWLVPDKFSPASWLPIKLQIKLMHFSDALTSCYDWIPADLTAFYKGDNTLLESTRFSVYIQCHYKDVVRRYKDIYLDLKDILDYTIQLFTIFSYIRLQL